MVLCIVLVSSIPAPSDRLYIIPMAFNGEKMGKICPNTHDQYMLYISKVGCPLRYTACYSFDTIISIWWITFLGHMDPSYPVLMTSQGKHFAIALNKEKNNTLPSSLSLYLFVIGCKYVHFTIISSTH